MRDPPKDKSGSGNAASQKDCPMAKVHSAFFWIAVNCLRDTVMMKPLHTTKPLFLFD